MTFFKRCVEYFDEFKLRFNELFQDKEENELDHIIFYVAIGFGVALVAEIIFLYNWKPLSKSSKSAAAVPDSTLGKKAAKLDLLESDAQQTLISPVSETEFIKNMEESEVNDVDSMERDLHSDNSSDELTTSFHEQLINGSGDELKEDVTEIKPGERRLSNLFWR